MSTQMMSGEGHRSLDLVAKIKNKMHFIQSRLQTIPELNTDNSGFSTAARRSFAGCH
jgi:hypothetical protein